ncbi:MAG: Gfo/Idh/MocA family oxidoreductase, partial [Dehalococcoidia bacterium]|nr:Gfo/Idh/MocA family oxidoreductase [Dehalococcoidia bacterium]
MPNRNDNILRVAVLGAASFAEEAHIPDINAHPRGQVVALYSRSLAKAQEMAERTGVPDATDDLEALLSRSDIDAVTIVSSNESHHPYTMAALAAGKHVLCEKPMALNAAQAGEMTREAHLRSVVHQIAFTFRYTYCLEEMRRLITSGEIGTPHFVEIHSEVFSRLVTEPRAATWRDSAALHGAGHLGEMGSHFIDTINYLCGPTSGYISEAAAVAHTLPREVPGEDGTPRPVETLDLVSFLVRTEGGLQGQVLASRATPPPVSYGIIHAGERQRGHMGYVIVTGDRGALMATFTRGESESLRRLRPGEPWEPVPLPSEAADGRPHGVTRMLHSFVDAVLRGGVDGRRDAMFDEGY